MNKTIKGLLSVAFIVSALSALELRALWPWSNRTPVVKPVELQQPVKPVISAQKTSLFKSAFKGVTRIGLGAGGFAASYWLVNSPAIGSLLNFSGHNNLANCWDKFVGDQRVQAGLFSLAGAFGMHQLAQSKHTFVKGVTDNERINSWFENRIAGGAGKALDNMSPQAKKNIEEVGTNVVTELVTKKPGSINFPVYQSGAGLEDVRKAVNLELKNTVVGDQELSKKLDAFLNYVNRPAWYKRVWAFIFGKSKAKANNSGSTNIPKE